MRLSAVYTTVCYAYLIKNKEASVEDAERVLFLMQYRRMKEENRRVYEDKTYISEEGLHINYISDLLRVMPPTEMGIYPSIALIETTSDIPSRYTVKRNQKEAESYAKMPIEEIRRQVDEILCTEQLGGYYFAHKPYRNKLRRLMARYYGRVCLTKGIKKMKYMFYMFYMSVVSVVTIYMMLIPLKVLLFTVTKNEIIETMGMYLLLFIPWLIITYRWTRPTEFEINNGYLPKNFKGNR